MVEPVREFNKDKTYDELFADEYLKKLNEMEIDFLANHMVRYYPNGVEAERLIRLDEKLDHQVTVEYLLRQQHAKKLQQAKEVEYFTL